MWHICSVTSLSTVLTLRDSRVHICALYSGDIISYVEVTIDNRFHFGPILWVPDVNPDYSWVGFGEFLDNLRLRYKNNIIKDVSFFDYFFNYFRSNGKISVFQNTRKI